MLDLIHQLKLVNQRLECAEVPRIPQFLDRDPLDATTTTRMGDLSLRLVDGTELAATETLNQTE